MNLEEIKELRSDAVQYAAQALSPSNREWYERVVNALDQKDAEIGDLKASLAHMGGHLEIELEEADKLRAEIAKLRAALDRIIGVALGNRMDPDFPAATVHKIAHNALSN